MFNVILKVKVKKDDLDAIQTFRDRVQTFLTNEPEAVLLDFVVEEIVEDQVV